MSRFIDEATILIKAGNGGKGAVSWRRETYEPMGGPAGGDGGRGGDVWAVAHSNLGTLMDLRYKRKYAADNGKPGGGANKAGPDGEDTIVTLPIGSRITDAETGEFVVEMTKAGQKVLLAQGGRGGKGNTHFKSSTNQAPRYSQPGEEGTQRELKVELRLLADVGIVGYPNAGKSTLISKISAARPKIASYAFTTLTPNLGVVRLGRDKAAPTFVVADVPGLIEGASLGRGKGTKFLKHLDKTDVLVHLIDGAKLLKEYGENHIKLAEAIVRDREIIDTELYTFSTKLSEKPQLLALNKCELFKPETLIAIKKKLSRKKRYKDIFFISAAAHIGLDALLAATADELYRMRGSDPRKRNVTKAALPYEIGRS